MDKRAVLILAHLEQVNVIASMMRNRLPVGMEKEDLISAGTVGLIDAVDRFDHSKGAELKTFANWRIRGAMLDAIRRHLGGRHKTKVVHVGLQEIAQRACEVPSPYQAIAYSELPKVVAERIDRLTHNERAAVEAFLSDKTISQTAKKMRVSPTRVSQLRRAAFTKLKAA